MGELNDIMTKISAVEDTVENLKKLFESIPDDYKVSGEAGILLIPQPPTICDKVCRLEESVDKLGEMLTLLLLAKKDGVELKVEKEQETKPLFGEQMWVSSDAVG